jgi:hypothetical protein
MSANNQKQYMLEKQQRYLNFLLEEESREETVRRRVLQETGRLPKEKKTIAPAIRQRTSKPQTERVVAREVIAPLSANMSLTMDKYLPTRFQVRNVILDSSFRDTLAYPNANDFVVRLTEPITNVAAIRILRTEFYQPSNTTGYFVLNEVRVPLQLYNIESAYLFLNGYISTTVANDTNTTFFGRIGPGTETYPAITGDITQDPFIYVLQPMEPRMKRFHIKLLHADGSVYEVNNARVVINLAVYSLRP